MKLPNTFATASATIGAGVAFPVAQFHNDCLVEQMFFKWNWRNSSRFCKTPISV